MIPRQKVYLAAGCHTLALGSGRREFDPRSTERPGLLHYVCEAGRGVLSQLAAGGQSVDECVIANFMAARFNRQGHLAAMLPAVDEALRYKPSTRVEAACASGGVAIYTSIKSVLSGCSDTVLCLGVEVQNTVKALYGADYLAGAGYVEGERKQGHAFFFPGAFSDRAGAYAARHGVEAVRPAMAQWYAQAVENARLEPNAQEYHNTTEDLVGLGMTPPDKNKFLEHLNLYDCSKVSDGAAALLVANEAGLERAGIAREDAVEIVAFAQCEEDLTRAPDRQDVLGTTAEALRRLFADAPVGRDAIGVMELHDCFSITGLLALEASGLWGDLPGYRIVREGQTRREGKLPVNTTGGLIGFGHYTGGTGIREAVDLWRQLTGRAEKAQVKLRQPYGLMINMGGNDKTVTALLLKAAD